MNRTNTTSPSRHPKPLFVAVYCINIPLTVLGNTLLCWVVYRYQQLRTPNNTLLASLSCANMLNVFVFVSRLLIYFLPEVENNTLCTILTRFYNCILLLTTLHLCIISVDRMLAIKYPLKYPLWVTNRRAIILAILLWVIFVIQLSLRLVHLAAAQDDFWKHMSRCHGALKKSTKRQRYGKITISIVLSYIIPFFVMLTSYGIIFKVVKSQSHKAYPETQKQAKRKTELKAAKTIGLLIGAFVILYTPLYICSAISVTNVGDKRFIALLMRYSGYLSSCASWINPFVYAFTNKEVKDQLKKLLNRVCRQNN